jgi:hypothetical protein
VLKILDAPNYTTKTIYKPRNEEPISMQGEELISTPRKFPFGIPTPKQRQHANLLSNPFY